MCSVIQGKYFLKKFCMVRVVKLAQVAQRGGRCPIPGNIQGQVGQGSEQPGLVKDAPAHCRQAVDYYLVKLSVVTKMRNFISDTLA